MLLIDAVFSVVIVCSYDLFDFIDIDEWYGTLAEEIKRECQWWVVVKHLPIIIPTPLRLCCKLMNLTTHSFTRSAILRRRTIELIGRWVTIKLSQDKHPAVYELCLNHMQKGQVWLVCFWGGTNYTFQQVEIYYSQNSQWKLSHLCQDLVVRLTAATALQAAVSDFAFYPSAFR